MFKQLKAFAAGVALTAASAAFAAPVTDTNNYGQGLGGQIIGIIGNSFTDAFNITSGYNPLTQTITSASATFELWDILGSETVRIDLGPTTSWAGTGSFVGDLTLGSSVVGNVLLDLQADGILSYTLRAISGSFVLERASLTADVTSKVPEPATLALVGLALAGIGAQRKLKARK